MVTKYQSQPKLTPFLTFENITQLFSADATMCRNSNFVFVLPMKVCINSKVGKFSKIEEIFTLALTAQKQQKYKILVYLGYKFELSIN